MSHFTKSAIFSYKNIKILELACNDLLQTRLLGIIGCGSCCYGLVAWQHTPIEISWYTGYCDMMVAKEE